VGSPAARSVLLLFVLLSSTGLVLAQEPFPEAGASPAPEASPSPAPSPAPAASPTPAPPKLPSVSWKNGRTTVEFDKAEITLTNRIQLRYIHEMPDEATRLSAPAGGVAPPPGASRGSFRIRRVENQLAGWVYTKDIEYELEFAFQDQTSAVLNDVDMNFHVKDDLLQLQLGQFKVPFGRQELTSSFKQEFADRSIVADQFEHSRDVGFMAFGQTEKARFAYAAGLFNGGGRGRFVNDNTKYMYDARVMFQPWGDVAFSEADFESAGHPLLAVGLQFEDNDARGATAGNDELQRTWGIDTALKYKGLYVLGEWFARHDVPETGGVYDSGGWHAQVGYFLVGRRFEVAGRWATVDPDRGIDDDARRELGGVLNYFYNKHALKVQADVRRLEDLARDTVDHQVRVQAQVIF
jgi:phosphate-selective porin OprO/OprP